MKNENVKKAWVFPPLVTIPILLVLLWKWDGSIENKIIVIYLVTSVTTFFSLSAQEFDDVGEYWEIKDFPVSLLWPFFFIWYFSDYVSAVFNNKGKNH